MDAPADGSGHDADSNLSVTELRLESAVIPGQTVQIDIVTFGPATSARAGVLELAFFDAARQRLRVPGWPHHSSLFGEYLYLRAKQHHPRRSTLLVTAPEEASVLSLVGHPWSGYEGLELMGPPRVVPVEEAAATVQSPIGGEQTSGIALAGVKQRHNIPFDVAAVEVEIPVQGNLRPTKQVLHLQFLSEQDEVIEVPDDLDSTAVQVDIPVETKAGSWRKLSDEIVIPDGAAVIELIGPEPGSDQNPVTLTRLPGIRWLRSVADEVEKPEATPRPGQEPPYAS